MTEPDASELDRWCRGQLDRRRHDNLLRRLPEVDGVAGRVMSLRGRELVNFGSNDYLGFASQGRLVEASVEATRRLGTGATASRLLAGNHELYTQLERAVARLKGTDAALVYPTGYQANVGCLGTLLGAADAVVADRLIHASLIDGIGMSGARLRRYRHNDMDHLQRQLDKARQSLNPGGRLAVVTESIFSMDGDESPIEEIARCADRAGAVLVVDDAHGTGVLGPTGGGALEGRLDHTGNVVVLGTFSKALGSLGGFVAASARVTEYLVTSSRGLIYSTGLPPGVVAASIEAVNLVQHDEAPRRRVLELSARVRRALVEAGLDVLPGRGPIVPVSAGSAERVLEWSDALAEAGLYVPAIRPPTVPPGGSRLRVSLSAAHTDEDVSRLIEALVGLVGHRD